MKKILAIVAGLILTLALSISPAPVTAAPLLDFNIDAIHPAGASISYAGGATPLVGSGIQVDSVVGLGTPLNPGLVPLTGYFLSFTTGNFTGSDPLHWNFGGGGSVTISNGTTNLLTGNFLQAIVTNQGNSFKVAVATFLDTKDPTLLALFGLPNVTYLGNFNISFLATAAIPNAFSSTAVLSGDVANEVIPEPATMLLLGSGLVGLAGYARRKFKK